MVFTPRSFHFICFFIYRYKIWIFREACYDFDGVAKETIWPVVLCMVTQNCRTPVQQNCSGAFGSLPALQRGQYGV